MPLWLERDRRRVDGEWRRTERLAHGCRPNGHSVDVAKFAFSPQEITIEPGTRVRWTNHDETPHTVTSPAAKKAFASNAMDTDDQYEFAFAAEGDFPYFCTVHPMMTGVVHLRKAGSKSG